MERFDILDFFWLCLAPLLGSFANVCILRIPDEKSIVFPASHCPRCGKPLLWRDNVPILGFLLLRGRCRFCTAPISWQYPIVEAMALLLFAMVLWRDPSWGPSRLAGGVLAIHLLIIAMIDARHQIIPDGLNLSLALSGALICPFNDFLGTGILERIVQALLGAAAGFGGLLAVGWAGERIWKKEALGGGDIKMMGALGLFFGWTGVAATLFLGSSAGVLYAVFLMSRGKRVRQTYLPFGPFLAFGGMCFWLWRTPLARLFAL